MSRPWHRTKLTTTAIAIFGVLLVWTVTRAALAIVGIMPPIGHSPVDVVECIVLAALFVGFAVASRRAGEKARASALLAATVFWCVCAAYFTVSVWAFSV